MSRQLLRVMACLLSIVMAACGGGTRGSGGQLFDGIVSDDSGRALVGVSVTIVETGDSGVSDDGGRFSIETSPVSGNVEFLLESSVFTGRAIAKDIPDQAARVFVAFRVGQGSVPNIQTSVEVRERRPSPTRRPTQGPVVTSAPLTPAAGPIPTPSPSGGGGSDDEDDDDDDSSGPPDRTPSPQPSATSTVRDGRSVDIRGAISAISSSAVIVAGVTFVPTAETEYRGDDGDRVSLSDFVVGDEVRARGWREGDQILLERLEGKT